MDGWMMRMDVVGVGVLGVVFGLCSCAVKPKMEVRSYVLRDVQRGYQSDAMVDAEKSRYLYGALTLAEQKARLGQYYTVLWSSPEVGDAREMVFLYQQGATGAKVLEKRQKLGAGERRGRVEFSMIGAEYVKKGRILAWKCEMRKGGRVLMSRQSYLWQ